MQYVYNYMHIVILERTCMKSQITEMKPLSFCMKTYLSPAADRELSRDEILINEAVKLSSVLASEDTVFA